MRRAAALLALLCLAVAAAPAAAASSARVDVRVPAGWGSTLQVGVADQPGGAASVRAKGRVGARYQYLTGGVDTRSGWRTWNEDGTFASRYVAESAKAGVTPVLTYYQLLPSRPDRSGSEAERDFANLADPALMRAYFADLRLALQRAAEGGHRVVLHVEPDLWGYAQQAHGDDAAKTRAAVASSGDPELAGLPNDLAGFAQAVVRLRDKHAPKALVAWHLSTWGRTGRPPPTTRRPRSSTRSPPAPPRSRARSGRGST